MYIIEHELKIYEPSSPSVGLGYTQKYTYVETLTSIDENAISAIQMLPDHDDNKKWMLEIWLKNEKAGIFCIFPSRMEAEEVLREFSRL